MTISLEPRSSVEIRSYLKARLNEAPHRPGMFGGEMFLRRLFDHLACAEHREEGWAGASGLSVFT
ncbi:hypothetical protein [Nonomuraea sp. B19D2]|uniref:hypothetical protein n=1 Tax=Nonomuraea sp. B19D2 TaxID=3159561 RepID=UPI0032DA7FC6